MGEVWGGEVVSAWGGPEAVQGGAIWSVVDDAGPAPSPTLSIIIPERIRARRPVTRRSVEEGKGVEPIPAAGVTRGALRDGAAGARLGHRQGGKSTPSPYPPAPTAALTELTTAARCRRSRCSECATGLAACARDCGAHACGAPACGAHACGAHACGAHACGAEQQGAHACGVEQ